MLAFQPAGQLLQFLFAFLGVEFPRRFQRGYDLIVLFLGKMIQYVAFLVDAAALHRIVMAIHLVDRFA